MASYYKGTWWFCLTQHLLHFVNGLWRIFVSTVSVRVMRPNA
jgi:hypothetical protein